MTALPQRRELVANIHAAQLAGARLASACAEMGISLRTLQRWATGDEVLADGRPDAKRAPPACRLSDQEQQAVLAACMQPRFADL